MILPILTALLLMANSEASTEALKGAWIDIDLEKALANHEKNADTKAFCESAHYENGEADAILRFTGEGKVLHCRLDQREQGPCYEFGELSGDRLKLKYQDGSILSGKVQTVSPTQIHIEVDQPKIGEITPVEVWELAKVQESRIAHLYQAFRSCLKK